MEKQAKHKIKILIPGDFEKEYFSKAQEQYIQLIIKACNATVLLVHVGNPNNLPGTDNQIAFLRDYNKLSETINLNTQALCKRLINEEIEISCTILGHGNTKTELSEQIELFKPDFMLLKKHPQSLRYKYFSRKTSLLFIPENVPEQLPKQIAIITTSHDLPSMDDMAFFFTLARNSSKQLSFLKAPYNGQTIDNDSGLKKDLNKINLSYGINISTPEQLENNSPDHIAGLMESKKIDMAFIICRKEKKLHSLLHTNLLKKFINKIEKPFFYSKPSLN